LNSITIRVDFEKLFNSVVKNKHYFQFNACSIFIGNLKANTIIHGRVGKVFNKKAPRYYLRALVF